MNKTTLVTGATGNVGGELADLLAGQGAHVRAASRQPERARTRRPKLDWVRLDFDDPETWSDALRGVERLFLLAPPGEAQADARLIPFIDAALRAGVQRIVAMTAMGVEHAAEDVALRKVERHIIDSGVAYTLLRPNWFMQNFDPGFLFETIRESGQIVVPAADAQVSFIDVRDIAAVAAMALLDDAHLGQEYTLTGSEPLSYDRVAEIMTELACREVQYTPVSDADYGAALAGQGWSREQIDFMLGLFQAKRSGFAAQVSDDVQKVLGREPIRFSQFAREHASDWC